MKSKILIVEDEPQIAQLLADYLHDADYDTKIINNGTEVAPFVKKNTVNLILLDLMLPGKDGMEVCQQVRNFSDVPIIMVTAKVDEIDRLLGLGYGADDYICKPFSPREVVARIKAVLRRYAPVPKGDSIVRGPLSIDKTERRVTIDGKALTLTRVEFDLLVVFATRPGRVYSRTQLLAEAQGYEAEGYDRTVDSHIKNLRKKMAQVHPENEMIQTVYGVGYRFET